MSEELTHDGLLALVREAWTCADPVPDGLVVRMQAAAAVAASMTERGGLDAELMVLVERSAELVGVRGVATVYTLRFASDGVDLLLRVAVEGEGSRIDGWVVPPEPMTVRVLGPDGTAIDDQPVPGETGRFELTGLPAGMLRLRLESRDPARTPFVTPSFEI